MIEATGKLRAWGNSIGIVLPKEMVKAEGLSVNDDVEVIVKKKTNPLRGVFGMLKPKKKMTLAEKDKMWKQIDKDLDPQDW